MLSNRVSRLKTVVPSGKNRTNKLRAREILADSSNHLNKSLLLRKATLSSRVISGSFCLKSSSETPKVIRFPGFRMMD